MRYYFLKPLRPGQTIVTPILSVNPASLTLDRTSPGNVATFTASLNLDSGSAVGVTVTSSDPSVTLSPASFSLGGGNPITRTVTVTGATAGPDSVTLSVTAPGQATQTIGISRPAVPLDLTVTPASLVLDRVAPGNVGTFTAALNRVPESAVAVNVSSSDASVTVTPASFSLTTGNPPSRLVTLTGNTLGPSPVTISVSPQGLAAKSVTITRPPVTPNLLSGLALWLDASDAGTFTLNGSSVSQWRDKSGNTRHANQATTAFQPVYLSSGINGLPAVRGDGVDDLMTWAPFTSGTNHNFYVVAAFDTGINRYNQFGGFFGSPNGTASNNGFHADISENPSVAVRVPGGSDMTFIPANGATNIRSGVPAVYSFLRNGGNYRSKWTYGTMQSLTLAGGFVTSSTSSDRIFANYFTSISFRIAEVVCYSRDLTAAEEAALSGYFSARYGVGI